MYMTEKRDDVLIVGGGQAGLAAGYYAKQNNLKYQIIEASDRIGNSWRERYDSLRLFTPRAFSSLPGMAIEGNPETYPTKDDIADYLESYAQHYEMPIALSQEVQSLTTVEDYFKITTDVAVHTARSVVIATGAFQVPRIPEWVKPADGVLQIHSSEYRNPEQLQGSKVLVVGGGNSGAQITEELAEHDYSVTLSSNTSLRFLPAQIMGKSLFWWLDTTGLLNAPTASMRAKLLQKRGDPIIGGNLKRLIQEDKVLIKSGAVNMQGQQVQFADGSQEAYDSIIWGTGYALNYSFLQIPEALSKGVPVHEQGVSPTVKRLGYVGLGWLSSRNSGLVGGVGKDAKYVMENITRL